MAIFKLLMRYLKFLVVVLAAGLLFYSCDPCRNLDCRTSMYSGQFRIVSKTDGKDLVFGPNKIYDKNQIRFYSLDGSDTTFFEYEPIQQSGAGYDSILYVWFEPPPEIAYMRLSNGDVDTLAISYNSFNSKCCGTIEEITKFRFNNSVDIVGDQGTQEIKK